MYTALPRSESRINQLFKQLLQWKDPRAAWHRLFHRDSERWALIQFKDANAGFYQSRHTVTCERCGIRHTVHHSWPKFNPDRDQGFMLAEAHRRASSFAGQG
ncbi:hypothetical protein [Motiliproteus sediminis]|uniref:hypothetical protein n=1 Tax=Motiliproteus sediminis TaxID=1468178 RepID=UPI001AEFBABF|nr:hypothetical protein [Motiliproteus sediminis]